MSATLSHCTAQRPGDLNGGCSVVRPFTTRYVVERANADDGLHAGHSAAPPRNDWRRAAGATARRRAWRSQLVVVCVHLDHPVAHEVSRGVVEGEATYVERPQIE
jgi:hypothetical protein